MASILESHTAKGHEAVENLERGPRDRSGTGDARGWSTSRDASSARLDPVGKFKRGHGIEGLARHEARELLGRERRDHVLYAAHDGRDWSSGGCRPEDSVALVESGHGIKDPGRHEARASMIYRC